MIGRFHRFVCCLAVAGGEWDLGFGTLIREEGVTVWAGVAREIISAAGGFVRSGRLGLGAE